MALAQRLVLFVFCVGLAYGQRIPKALFEPVVVTSQQQERIYVLDTITNKTEQQQLELATLYARTQAYKPSFTLFEVLAEAHPNTYDYQFLLGGIAGTLASELPQMKSLPYIRTMKSAFERAAILAPDTLAVHLVLLELYTALPWVLGGSNKKATKTLETIQSLSVVEGFLAAGYFYRSTNKNKAALVAYLKAVNEVDSCSTPNISNDAYYHLGVLSYYLQKDITKALCFFEEYVARYSDGDRYPKAFARHYIDKLTSVVYVDQTLEAQLKTYDPLTSWIQNNFK